MPLSHCCGLWWLLRAGVARVGLVGVPCPAELCELLERLEGFGGFEAWQTAALNAYKKPLLRPEGALEPLLCLVVAFACGSGACWACWGTLSLRSYANF